MVKRGQARKKFGLKNFKTRLAVVCVIKVTQLDKGILC